MPLKTQLPCIPTKHVIGIDPGFSGAIALLNNIGLTIYDMPVHLIKGRNQVDAKQLNCIIKNVATEFAIIEDVHAMPEQGVTSTFRFGYNAGILLGVLAANDVKILRVMPAVWKTALGLSKNKKDSLALAKKTFPAYQDLFKRAKDDGRAEAALMAFMGYNNMR